MKQRSSTQPEHRNRIFRRAKNFPVNRFPRNLIFESGEPMTKISANDPDRAKGATEEEHEHDGNIGLEEQLGHRDQDPMLKDADSDFPEPGNNPEHTGGNPQKPKK
jgi:hypothetical protein